MKKKGGKEAQEMKMMFGLKTNKMLVGVLLWICIGFESVNAGVADETKPGPSSPSEFPEWWANLTKWRDETREQLNWKGGVYGVSGEKGVGIGEMGCRGWEVDSVIFLQVPGLAWTQVSYIQPQMHPFDLYFFDQKSQKYTVERWVRWTKDLYGGVDSVLMWPTYPMIGMDDRNQYDMFRAMPGGLEGVKNVTKQLHEFGIKVLWPYNPWDTGTRYEGKDDSEALPELIIQTDGDGFNGDTMTMIPIY